jgi:hypothetical protein
MMCDAKTAVQHALKAPAAPPAARSDTRTRARKLIKFMLVYVAAARHIKKHEHSV